MLSQTAGFKVGMPAFETDMVKRLSQAGGEGQKQLWVQKPLWGASCPRIVHEQPRDLFAFGYFVS